MPKTHSHHHQLKIFRADRTEIEAAHKELDRAISRAKELRRINAYPYESA